MSVIKRVGIIGAGPTGIACARFLLAERVFDVVDVFEQRSGVGGVWNLSGTARSKCIPVPQVDPDLDTRNSRIARDRDDVSRTENQGLEFESPLYDYLETNIPKTLMQYSDKPFDTHLPLYPGHEEVLRYLEEYAQPVNHLIQFNTQVQDISLRESTDKDQWMVVTRNVNTRREETAQYDALIIANGHYTIPHVPKIYGLAEFNDKYPGIVMHSKAYRRPEDFTNKKVLVIGNSASGLDIASQLAAEASHPVYLASRSASQLAPGGGGPAWRSDVPEVEEFLNTSDKTRAVRCKDGTIIKNLDAVLFATGYYYSFPFFKKSHTGQSRCDHKSTSTSPAGSSRASSADSRGSQHSEDDSLSTLTTTGLRTHHIYKHFLHIDHPTLAFPTLNLKIIPFPLAENQAAVIARLWSGRLDIPKTSVMQDWENSEQQRLLQAKRLRVTPVDNTEDAAHGKDKGVIYEGGFHTLVYPEDAYQINELYKWAKSAQPRDGLENRGVGKLGTRWNEQQVWLRGQFPDIKASFAVLGEDRRQITTLEQLGGKWENGYEKWSADRSDDEKKDLFTKAGVYL